MTGHADPGPDAHPDASSRVRVRRTGGFTGSTVEASLDLDRPDDDRAVEIRSLVDRIDLRGLARGRPYPDTYSYEFDLRGARATVPDHLLSPELRRLADLILPDQSR